MKGVGLSLLLGTPVRFSGKGREIPLCLHDCLSMSLSGFGIRAPTHPIYLPPPLLILQHKQRFPESNRKIIVIGLNQC